VLWRLGETCNPDRFKAFHESGLMQTILNSTETRCRDSGSKHPGCLGLVREDNPGLSCLRPPARESCQPRYWLRDFSVDTSKPLECKTTFSAKSAAAPSKAAAEADVTPVPASAAAPSVAPGGEPTAPAVPGPAAVAPDSKPPAIKLAKVCDGKTVYIQIFGPGLRDAARLLRTPWRELGANVPPIEDVLDTARRRNHTPPRMPIETTVIHHTGAEQACAKELKTVAASSPGDPLLATLSPAEQWRVVPLPSSLSASPGTIEVWLVPKKAP
jgi:hypothetical protein